MIMKKERNLNEERLPNKFQSSQETESFKPIMAWDSIKCDSGTNADEQSFNELCTDISNNTDNMEFQTVFNGSNVSGYYPSLSSTSADHECSFPDTFYPNEMCLPITWSPDFDYTNSGHHCEDNSRSLSEHKVNDISSCDSSAPRVKFVPVRKYDIHIYPSAESEDSEPSNPATKNNDKKADGQERVMKKKKKLKFNANNNFVRHDPRNYVRVKRWSDENVATPRVEELAKPLYDKSEWKGHRHCTWEEYGKRVQSSRLRPSQVNWSRLAAPKLKMEPQFNDVLQSVSSPALRFEATKRIIKLAQPKKKIDCNDYYLWLWNRKPKNQEMLKKVKKLTINRTDLVDARVLLRCDLDYTTGKPIEEKIAKIVPTILGAFKKKARAVVIVSHCGNPNGRKDESCSLQAIQKPLEKALGMMVVFLDDCIGAEAVALSEDPEPGYILLLENVRFHPEELGYKINADGCKEPCTLAQMKTFRDILYNEGDVYINDAFTLLDSECTSNIGPSEKDRALGNSIKREMAIFNYFCVTPGTGLVLVIGGTFAEVADIVTNFMGKAMEILLGGPIAYAFIKTLMDVEMGDITVTEAEQKKIRKMMVRARDTNCVINLPSDLVVQNVKSPGVYYTGHTKDGLDDYYEPVDIGPLTRCCYWKAMERAEKIVWHGMMGELPDGTSAIACGFAQANNRGAGTYLADATTADIFHKFCPQGSVSHITENSEVTMMLLHRKLPKGLSTLSPYRKKIKKRPPKQPFVSNKPTSYGSACMRLDNALDRLSIEQLDLKDKTVVIRANFNVGVTESNILENNYCLRMIIPNIKYALQSEAFAVVLLGSIEELHSTDNKKTQSLRPVAKELARLLNLQVKFLPEVSFPRVKTILKESYPGAVIVMENVNSKREEHDYRTPIKTLEQIEKVTSFCQEFSSIGDVYVNDAFGSLLENTATTSGCLLRHRACGFLQKSELRYLSATFLNPPRPFLIILGGKRGNLKYEALRSIMCEVDQIIITGALAFGFLKLVQNVKVGKSVYDPGLDGEILKVLALAKEHEVKLYFPVDFVITDSLNKDGSVRQVSASTGIPDDWFAVDIGDKSCSLFRQIIKRSKLILWQGVSGVTEIPKFTWGTSTMLEAVITATQDKEHKAVSILSGMSLCSFIEHNNPDHEGISHVTTGGMAVFSLIKDRSLPSLRRLTAVHKKRALNRLCIDQVDFKDMTIMVRANFNLPVDDLGEIEHPLFLKDLVPSIKFLQRKGAKSIILVGHRDEPNGKPNDQLSLFSAKRTLESFLKQDVVFVENGVTDSVVSTIKSAEAGKIFMLENMRFHEAEEGWEMEQNGVRMKMPYQKIFDFRNILGKMCDIYVNEDLNSLSYCDSSVVGVPAKFKAGGLLLKNELTKFRVFLDKMSTPFLAIIGSHNHFQLASKLEMTFDLLDSVTALMLCGDIAWHVLKYMKGNSIKLGDTPINTDVLKYIPRIIRKASINNITIHLPTDFHINELREEEKVDPVAPPESGEVGEEEEEESEIKYVPVVGTVKTGLKGDQKALDIGPETLSSYQEIIKTAKSILLLGPTGEFTLGEYGYGCRGILSAIEEAREDGAASLAFGYDTNTMLTALDAVAKVDHVSSGNEACVDLIRGALLPGLEALSPPPHKPLKKLSVQTFVLAEMRVLLRLDLDIPIVEGVVLDKTKLDRCLPTIKFLLNNGVKSVAILGHRGRPRGYRNDYLTLKPLAEEFSHMLQTNVQFLEEPCGVETRAELKDPPKGSVFLMENLKFYPAETGRDAPIPKPLEEEVPEEDGENEDLPAVPSAVTEASDKKEEEETEPTETGEETETGAEETEETEATATENDTDMIQEATDPENIDKLMYQLMSPKTVQEYIDEITECGDVFVNDDIIDIETKLTSMTGFACQRKMCGLMLKDFIATYDTEDVYQMLGVASLSKGPREGEMAML